LIGTRTFFRLCYKDCNFKILLRKFPVIATPVESGEAIPVGMGEGQAGINSDAFSHSVLDTESRGVGAGAPPGQMLKQVQHDVYEFSVTCR